MKALGNIIGFTLIMAFVVAIIYFVYQGTILIWTNLDVLADGQRILLVAAVITILLFAVILAWGMRSSAQMRNSGRLSERRYTLYVHVLAVMRGLLDEESDIGQKEALAAELVAANADFMILGSSKSLKSYIAFRESLERGEMELLLDCFQAVWKNMRKDLVSNDDFDSFNINDVICMLPKVRIEFQEESVAQSGPASASVRERNTSLIPDA